MTEATTTQPGPAPSRRAGLQLSLAAKLLGVGLLGVALVAATGAAGWVGSQRVASKADRIHDANQLLRVAMIGDMMRDGIYGDVYTSFKTGAKDHDEVAHKLTTMKISGMSGALDFTAGPVPGVALIPITGAQWRPGKTFPWEMFIIDNSQIPIVPLNGDLQMTNA